MEESKKEVSIRQVEQRVLNCLDDAGKNAYKIAADLDLSYASVYQTLKVMFEKGLVKCVKSGRRSIWVKVL